MVTRRSFIAELKRELRPALQKLQRSKMCIRDRLYLERESFEELHAALGRIEPRERGYIEYRFGFDDEDTERTLTQTARHFHLSESRARMTERQAVDDVRLELPWWY